MAGAAWLGMAWIGLAYSTPQVANLRVSIGNLGLNPKAIVRVGVGQEAAGGEQKQTKFFTLKRKV